jgi:hypothetical protein
LFVLFSGCSVGTSKAEEARLAAEASREPAAAVPSTGRGATIKIEPGSPADTVRAFYAKLREKKYREAIYLTNLRPAIEGLTDIELKEFEVDLDSIATDVPAVLEINGEIVTGEQATVTLKLPDTASEKPVIQDVRLRRENDVWTILTADPAAEALIRKEGRNYLNSLRIETHQAEAKKMLERVSKAQMVFSLQNGGTYSDLDGLVKAGFLPVDIRTPDSTGYLYAISVSDDGRGYYATATPAVYGKSGKYSYLLEPTSGSLPRVRAEDRRGKPMRQ